MKPDEFDKQLLRLLQQNNRLTAEELAEAVNLSASAVQRRLKKLRDEKIIEADVSIVFYTHVVMDKVKWDTASLFRPY